MDNGRGQVMGMSNAYNSISDYLKGHQLGGPLDFLYYTKDWLVGHHCQGVQDEAPGWSESLMSGRGTPLGPSCAQCSRDCYILARPAEIPSLDHSLRKMVKPAGTKSEKFVPGRGCDYFSDGNSHPNTPTPAQNWLIAQFDSLG